MRIAIIDPLGSPYDGNTPFVRGLGGSESAVVFMARELARLGLIIDVYNNCNQQETKEGEFERVSYRSFQDLQKDLVNISYDVVIVSRTIKPFEYYDFGGAFKVVWLHDTFVQGDEQFESMLVQNKIDEVWTLSDWHTSYITTCNHSHKRMMEVIKRKLWQTRNGANLWCDVDANAKNRSSFVFNASVNKGMKVLLDRVWPEVKKRLPDARLTVIGGFYNLTHRDAQQEAAEELMLRHHGKNDVDFTGIISQKEVAHIISRAGFMIYPQENPETYGISTLESLAYGTPVISGRFGAMEETAVDQACYLMDYPAVSNSLYHFNDDVHIEHFVRMVVDAYHNEYLWKQKVNKALEVREVCTWDTIALQWKQHLYRVTGRYLDVEDYHKANIIHNKVHRIFGRRWSNPEEFDTFYPEEEKKIWVIVPFHNADSYLRECLTSIRAQDYTNYSVLFIDDKSDTPKMFNLISKLMGIDNRYEIFRNDHRIGALANQVKAIEEYIDAGNDDIIMLIDGDDKLVNNPNIFKMINRLYHEGAEMTYGSCWSMADNIPLIAQEYPRYVFTDQSFRSYKFPWNIPYTHLRTFSYGLFLSIDDDKLRDPDGNYYKAGGDSALFYALIEECSYDAVRAVRQVTYMYNDKNPNNDYKVNDDEQKRNSKNILMYERDTNAFEEIKQGLEEDVSTFESIKRGLEDAIAYTKGDTSRGKIVYPKTSVLIAIPTAKNIHPDTFKSIYDLKVDSNIQTTFQYFYGYRIDQIRNLIADWAVGGFDYLFAVDYDIGFSPETLIELFKCNCDIATGVYRQRSHSHIPELYKNNDHGGQTNLSMNEIPPKSIFEVDACGFGCALITRDILEKVGYPQFEYHPSLDIKDTVSEDIDFCRKAKKHGAVIKANSNILCNHYGEFNYSVNL